MCVTFLNEDQIWTSGLTGEVKCLTIGGVLCSTLDTRSGDRPNDIVVDRDRTLLYSDEPTKSINKVKNDQTEEVIQLHGWIPFNLCVTSSGDLLVTMYSDEETQSKVVRYTDSTVRQTIQSNLCTQESILSNKFQWEISLKMYIDFLFINYSIFLRKNNSDGRHEFTFIFPFKKDHFLSSL